MKHIPQLQSFKRLFVLGAVILCASLFSRVWLYVEEREVPRIKGLPQPIRPIHIVELESDQFQNRLNAERHRNAGAEARCQRLAMFHLGLVSMVEPPITPPYESWLDKILPQVSVPAFYIGGTDTIYTIDRLHPSVRHEWVHAIDDQYSERIRRSSHVATTDERVALRAAIEGTAQVLIGAPPIPLPIEPDLDRGAWAFAYNVGPLYVKRQASHDLSELFALAPRTTHEVLYDNSQDPVDIAPPPLAPRERLLCSDRLGALGVLVAFRKFNSLTPEVYHTARSWRGDRLDLLLVGDRHRIRWHVVFADSQAARFWAQGPAAHWSLLSTAVPVQIETSVDLASN